MVTGTSKWTRHLQGSKGSSYVRQPSQLPIAPKLQKAETFPRADVLKLNAIYKCIVLEKLALFARERDPTVRPRPHHHDLSVAGLERRRADLSAARRGVSDRRIGWRAAPGAASAAARPRVLPANPAQWGKP